MDQMISTRCKKWDLDGISVWIIGFILILVRITGFHWISVWNSGFNLISVRSNITNMI